MNKTSAYDDGGKKKHWYKRWVKLICGKETHHDQHCFEMLSIHHFETLSINIVVMVVVFPQFWKMFPPHKAEERAPWSSANLPLLYKLPHQELYNLWKTYGDILKLKLGLICTIVISSPHMAIEVLKRHHQVFASSCLLPIAAHSISSNEWPWCKMGVSRGQHYWQFLEQKS